MRITKEMKDKVINGWLNAGNARLYKEVDGDGYFVDIPWEEQLFIEDYDKLYDEAIYNTLMAVQSLREQGETDKDIEGYGYILPETIDRWHKIEDCRRIDRILLKSGGYLYRGRLNDGRYFLGGQLNEPATIVHDYAMQMDIEDLAEDPFDIHTGEETIASLGELWLYTDKECKHEYFPLLGA